MTKAIYTPQTHESTLQYWSANESCSYINSITDGKCIHKHRATRQCNWIKQPQKWCSYHLLFQSISSDAFGYTSFKPRNCFSFACVYTDSASDTQRYTHNTWHIHVHVWYIHVVGNCTTTLIHWLSTNNIQISLRVLLFWAGLAWVILS